MEQFADRTPLETITFRSEKTRPEAIQKANDRAKALTKETGRQHTFRLANKLERGEVYEVFAIEIEPIEAAVAPLKDQAIERAEKEALETIEQCREELAAADGNLSKVAPYPSGREYGYGWKYYSALYKYQLFSAITKWRETSYSSRDDIYADINPDMCAKFVERRKREAGEQYDEFVAKLIGKIGHVVQASLEGSHVWAHSILSVVKVDGTIEKWKTQQIVNVSKLGKHFNQWPTRKMKR